MKFNTNKYRIYNWNHFMMAHWVINPGMAFNELILGQRVPKVMLEDKASDKPRYERTIVPCPHCETLHDGRTWSAQNNTAYKNWFGLYCPACSNVIPCLNNFTSLILLAVTFPLWGWFRKSLKAQWLAKQPDRFKKINVDIVPNPFADKSWIAHGIGFGVLMLIIMEIVFPAIEGGEISWLHFALGIPLWFATGLSWGYIMKKFMSRKGRNGEDYNGYIERKPW